jgi:hypothetical protein
MLGFSDVFLIALTPRKSSAMLPSERDLSPSDFAIRDNYGSGHSNESQIA